MNDQLRALFAEPLAALEAAANDSDWRDVRSRARRQLMRHSLVRGGTISLVVVIATLAATPAFGLRGGVMRIFSNGEPAAPRVVQSFSEMDKAAPEGMATGVIASETRRVATFPLSAGDVVLSVAPTRAGGFCADYSKPVAGGGCDRDRTLPFARGLSIDRISADGQIQGMVALSGWTLIQPGERVEVQFADGETDEVPLTWVSAPIDAGFFLYEVPDQHRTLGHWPTLLVLEDKDGNNLARADVPSLRAVTGRR